MKKLFSIFKFQFPNKKLYPIPYTLNFNRGFTLIELLVVIGIITLVTAILFPNFMGVRQRGRDAQRKSDIKQIQSALEIYKLDNNPPLYPTALSPCGQCWTSQGTDCSTAGVNIYMRKLPCDPGSNDPTPYVYQRSDALKYTLSTCLENLVDPDRDSTPNASCTTTNTSYTINEP